MCALVVYDNVCQETELAGWGFGSMEFETDDVIMLVCSSIEFLPGTFSGDAAYSYMYAQSDPI